MKKLNKIALTSFLLLSPLSTFTSQTVQADTNIAPQSTSQSSSKTADDKNDNKTASTDQTDDNQSKKVDKRTDNSDEKTAKKLDDGQNKTSADDKTADSSSKQSKLPQNDTKKETPNSNLTKQNNNSNANSSSNQATQSNSVNDQNNNSESVNNKTIVKTAPENKAKTKKPKHDEPKTDLSDFYVTKTNHTNSIANQKQRHTKPVVISKKTIYHHEPINNSTPKQHKLPQTTSILPILPTASSKQAIWHHNNQPMTLKSAALGLSACVVFLIGISTPSRRY